MHRPGPPLELSGRSGVAGWLLRRGRADPRAPPGRRHSHRRPDREGDRGHPLPAPPPRHRRPRWARRHRAADSRRGAVQCGVVGGRADGGREGARGERGLVPGRRAGTGLREHTAGHPSRSATRIPGAAPPRTCGWVGVKDSPPPGSAALSPGRGRSHPYPREPHCQVCWMPSYRGRYEFISLSLDFPAESFPFSYYAQLWVLMTVPRKLFRYAPRVTAPAGVIGASTSSRCHRRPRPWCWPFPVRKARKATTSPRGSWRPPAHRAPE